MSDAVAFMSVVRAALQESGTPHMVVGSTVVNWIGPARSTQDVDIVIAPREDQLRQLVARLVSAGYYIDEASALEALRRRSMVNAIDPDSGWKLDLIVFDEKPYSRAAFSRRVQHESPAGVFDIQTPEDLILSKLVWRKESQSERQMRDVVGVFNIWRSQIDVGYLSHWADELGVRDEVEDLFRRLED